MPRELKISANDIQRARRDWYTFHYDKRTTFKALPINDQHIYENAAFRVSPPDMTIYGGLRESWPTSEEMQILMKIQGMRDTDLCNPWYVSDAGWNDFQQLWAQLPEPVDLSREQSYPIVHVVQNPAELSPRQRA